MVFMKLEFDKVVKEIIFKSPKSIVLDLRGNPGGYLDTSVKVAAEWLATDQGVVVSEKTNNGQIKKYDAIIALGAVIHGETEHFTYVCQQVSYGVQRVMLDEQIPIIFGVLTTQTFLQAQDRVGGRKGHMGIEAAQTALAMISVKKQIQFMD